jgi:hypothetical protein
MSQHSRALFCLKLQLTPSTLIWLVLNNKRSNIYQHELENYVHSDIIFLSCGILTFPVARLCGIEWMDDR